MRYPPPAAPPRHGADRDEPLPSDSAVLLRQLALRDLALDRIRQGLCVFDGQQRLLLFNQQYAEMYGLDPAQLWVGMTLGDVVNLRYAAGTGPEMSPEQYAAWRARIGAADRVTNTEVTLRNGRVHVIHHEPTPGGGYVASFEDVTERRQAEAHVRHMAHHDALTGLPNRILFTERLEQTVARLRGESRLEDHRPAPDATDWLIAVLFLDLDQFKDVNDTLGHAAGDELLRLVAVRIGRCIRAEDTLARLGGDEFAVLLESCTTPERVAEVAQRMIGVVSEPFVLDGREAVIGTSVGITLCIRGDAEDTDPARLLRQADMALYRVKAEGRGAHRFFQTGMHAVLHRRKEMEHDLRRALADGGLDVHFQPMVMLAAPQRIVGAEALARWRHPEHGMVPPSEFIPLAEGAGLIGELGAWVLRTACARAARWPELHVAVNLSPEQVRRPGLVDLVTAVLAETRLPPSRLELEITEGILLHDTAATLVTLDRLRTLGVGIALDDFGTGYSSLSYLRRFPFSKLKVDRSFIAGITTDPGAAAIVQAVVSLGRSLAIRVTAEGVETEEQVSLLRAIGCEEAQGYLFGHPCPAEAFERLAVPDWKRPDPR
ncbi:MAG: EAL domain-containing protein [Proteobacteria bacterium]|nr:EAL domain-containing protein [Pseudomonadota bacterium]